MYRFSMYTVKKLSYYDIVLFFFDVEMCKKNISTSCFHASDIRFEGGVRGGATILSFSNNRIHSVDTNQTHRKKSCKMYFFSLLYVVQKINSVVVPIIFSILYYKMNRAVPNVFQKSLIYFKQGLSHFIFGRTTVSFIKYTFLYIAKLHTDSHIMLHHKVN